MLHNFIRGVLQTSKLLENISTKVFLQQKITIQYELNLWDIPFMNIMILFSNNWNRRRSQQWKWTVDIFDDCYQVEILFIKMGLQLKFISWNCSELLWFLSMWDCSWNYSNLNCSGNNFHQLVDIHQWDLQRDVATILRKSVFTFLSPSCNTKCKRPCLKYSI